MNGLTPSRQIIALEIAAFGVVDASLEELTQLRKNPGDWSAGGESPATHLKLVDEQAVLATVALLRAIDGASWRDKSFADWAVISAPRFPGRVRGAAGIARYLKLGPRALSPLIIPTLSLHSVSSVVSMILQSHGANFGTSGDRFHVSEALLMGFSVQHSGRTPGAWVVLTGFEPEPQLDANGRIVNTVQGYGIAMALVDETAVEPGIRLTYDPKTLQNRSAPITISELAGALRDPEKFERWNCPVEGGGVLTLKCEAHQLVRAA